MDYASKEARALQPRYFWLDVARVIAIVSVTFNHALSRSFATREGSLEEFLQMSVVGSYLKALLYTFSRIGVPLFLMITGSLLLKRDYEEKGTISRFLRHNWLELFRTTLIWLFIMFWYLQTGKGEVLRSVGIAAALKEFFCTMLFINQTTLSHMWYMPMILIVYLMIPVISVGIKRIGDKFFYILFAVATGCGILIPSINALFYVAGTTIHLDFAFSITDLFSLYFIYILAGYWISGKKLERIPTGWIYLGFVVSFLVTALFQFWAYSTPRDYYLQYADIGILISAVFLFELVRRKSGEIQHGQQAVTYLSRISLGIFFLHLCVMTFLILIMNKVVHIERFPRFIILEVASFLLSVLIIWVTSKNKKIGRYLYLIK